MTVVFLKLVNMSIAAGFLVLAVIALRLFLKKSPKWVYCVLWGLVGIRLICPLSVESIFSLIPSAETVPQEIVYAERPAIHSGVAYLNSYVNPILSEKLAPSAEAGVSPMQTIIFVATVIWLVGFNLETLIHCSAPRKIISACPLAFGEVSVERRVKNVLHYKKPAFWVLVAGVVACIVAAVCFLTNPVDTSEEPDLYSLNYEKAISQLADEGVVGLEVDAIEYVYKDSSEFIMPRLSLYMEDKQFHFSYSMWSSYLPHGTFEMTDTELVLTAGDYGQAKRKYVFKKDDKNYVFDADKSSGMPKYKYRADEEAQSPVPDGAIFEPIVVHFSQSTESGYSAIIDSMMADIDNDGRAEVSTLTYGPTSGLFTFKFFVKDCESGELEYFNIFNTTYYQLAFRMDLTGHFYLSGKTQNGTEEAYMLKITFEDGNIVLTPDEDSKGVIEYWGQGIDSE
ncbi:MAG: hypothetical protein IKK59_08125 [Lachnospiraceae bacterium]|nr:hypothetical protein [Lachnospiraceae bacterium]